MSATVHVVDASGTELMDAVRVDCPVSTIVGEVLMQLPLLLNRPYDALALYVNLADVCAQRPPLPLEETVANGFTILPVGRAKRKRQRKSIKRQRMMATTESPTQDLYVVPLVLRQTPPWTRLPDLDEWQQPQQQIQPREYDDDDDAMLWQLPRVNLDGFDFHWPADHVTIAVYRRHVWQRLESSFLTHDVVTRGKIGWLRGQRGTGRSLLLLTYALSTLHPAGWTITWVSLARGRAVRIHCDKTLQQKHILPHPHQAQDLQELLNEVPASQNHFVMVENVEDDSDLDDSDLPTTLGVLARWLYDDNDDGHKRLVVSSIFAPCSIDRQCFARTPVRVVVGGDGGAVGVAEDSKEEADDDSIVVRLLPAWTPDEFVAAVQHDAIYEFVRDCLDACDATAFADLKEPLRRELLACAKFYYAGGNALNLFRINTSYLEHGGHETVSRLTLNFSFFGHPVPINLVDLYACADDDADAGDNGSEDGTAFQVVAKVWSPFLAARFAMHGGAKLVRFVNEPANHTADRIAVQRGTMLEAQFYASLWGGSLLVFEPSVSETDPKITSVVHTWNGPIHWLYVEPNRPECVLDSVFRLDYNPHWWKLPLCQIGGFDVVFVDTQTGLVRFVQLAKPPFTQRGAIHWAFATKFLEDLTTRARQLSEEQESKRIHLAEEEKEEEEKEDTEEDEAEEEEEDLEGKKETPMSLPLVIRSVEMFVVMDEKLLSSFRIESMSETQRMVNAVQRLTTDSRWATDENGVRALVKIVGMRDCWTSWQDCEAYEVAA